MKIYTKTGDDGDTSLFGGVRITKSHHRIEAYGHIDELNASIGHVIALAEQESVIPSTICDQLRTIQQELFVVGSHLATPYDPAAIPDTLPAFPDAAITTLEEHIDAMQQELPVLKRFILPGGTPTGSATHVARTICRRTERAIVRLAAEEALLPNITQYINRLSDYLFVLARIVNHATNQPETHWPAE